MCTAANDTMGERYWGTVNVTINNRSCQRWDTTSPHNHSFIDLEVSYVSFQFTLLIYLIFNVKCTFGYNEPILIKLTIFIDLMQFSFCKYNAQNESCLGAFSKTERNTKISFVNAKTNCVSKYYRCFTKSSRTNNIEPF